MLYIKTYNNILDAVTLACRMEVDGSCAGCPLEELHVSNCALWAQESVENSRQAAELLGYEVLDDEEAQAAKTIISFSRGLKMLGRILKDVEEAGQADQ